MSRISDGYTGHLFEEEVFGRCRALPHGYMRWREAAAEVRKNQPPFKTPVAARLEREVRRQVGGEAKFFTAVRSALDVFHGVDGFFQFRGVVVTIDLTCNPDKDEDCGKADLIVCKDDLGDIPALAARIVREMKSKERRWCS